MKIRTESLTELTVARFQRMRQVVDLNPAYQREGGVWKPETRARLIDSILNGFDVPKLYFERATKRRLSPDGLTYQYSVLDGKQRLEAILGFLSGELRLPDDFIFFEDPEVDVSGMTLAQLEQSLPLLARRFLDYQLPVISVVTDSGDLIEEMFQRLNASSALNAAERRNALSGPTRDAANSLAKHTLLVDRSPIKSARYKYRELASKFLAVEHQLDTKRRIVDTKADTLYSLFSASRTKPPKISSSQMGEYEARASGTLDRMAEVFEDSDSLLRSIGTVVVYYLVFREPKLPTVDLRRRLEHFEDLRRAAARMGEDAPDYATAANARLREYNVFVQSTNDGKALTRRAAIMSAFLHGYLDADPLAGLRVLSEGELPEHDESEA